MTNKIVYRKEVKMRVVGMGGIEVTIPKIIIERAANKAGQTPKEFAKSHKVVHLFNDFRDFDAAYRFVPVQETEKIEVPEVA